MKSVVQEGPGEEAVDARPPHEGQCAARRTGRLRPPDPRSLPREGRGGLSRCSIPEEDAATQDVKSTQTPSKKQGRCLCGRRPLNRGEGCPSAQPFYFKADFLETMSGLLYSGINLRNQLSPFCFNFGGGITSIPPGPSPGES